MNKHPWSMVARMVLSIAFACCATKAGAQSPSDKPATTITVAAAADLKYALDEVNSSFAKDQPHIKVNVAYGSSGQFFAQLSNKAPFDMFLSADLAYPRKLVEQGLANNDDVFPYAVGRIVVWALKDLPVDVKERGIRSLLDPAIKRIAIANPKHAPYGGAAEAALKKLGVYEQVKAKLVLGENIAQTAQYIESGAADVGIIALSLAESPALRDKGQLWQVPLDSYPRMEQGGVILSWVKDRAAAATYRQFIMSESGRQILKRYGFFMPED